MGAIMDGISGNDGLLVMRWIDVIFCVGSAYCNKFSFYDCLMGLRFNEDVYVYWSSTLFWEHILKFDIKMCSEKSVYAEALEEYFLIIIYYDKSMCQIRM